MNGVAGLLRGLGEKAAVNAQAIAARSRSGLLAPQRPEQLILVALFGAVAVSRR